jgi:hypothetical protein
MGLASGGIPFLVTNAMKTALRALGKTDAEIWNLTPADAHGILEADAKRRLNGAAAQGAPQSPAVAPTGGSTITWASTSHSEADRLPIGKVWVTAGKWGVTDAVRRPGKDNTYAFESVAYRDLEEMADDIARRITGGCWTMIAGAPRPELDLSLLHRRIRSNFHDAPTTTFTLDVDGMTPPKGKDLSGAEHFGDAVVDVFRARLKRAGIHSLANAKLILLATASTGFAHNSKGEPARGCARFRIILELGSPLTLGQQKALTAALGKLPGFKSLDPAKVSCFDTDICTLSGNIFVAAAQGINDPIQHRVYVFDAEDGDGVVDVDQLAAELKLAEVPPVEPEAPRKPKGERVMQAPPEKREALLSALVKALPNEPGFDRLKWVGVAHACWGAADGEDWAYDVWTEWSLRWPGGDDPLDRERTWNSLPEGDNGIEYLLGWAHNVGTPEALAAVQAIELAIFDRIDDDDDGGSGDGTGKDDDENEDDALLARIAPKINPKAFYGPLARIVDETTRYSEATKVGVAAQLMARASLTLRPFYNDLGNNKIPLNVYLIQLGLSGKGRKGTSAVIADQYFAPVVEAVAREILARLAFSNTDAMELAAAETAVDECSRKIEWTKNVQPEFASEREAELNALVIERDTMVKKIKALNAHLDAKVRPYRAVQEYKKLIAEAEARKANADEIIAATEAELSAIRTVLEDPAAAMAKARKDHKAAAAKLAALPSPPSGPPEPWLEIFASLSKGPVTLNGVGSGEGLIHAIRDPGFVNGPRGKVADAGVDNKVLFIDQDEFGGTLAVIVRPGSTLSTSFRTLFDCRPTGSATKNTPEFCKEPYTVLSASITPAELMGKMFDKHDSSAMAENGFGNRPLYLWTMRDKRVAHPLATPGLPEMMEDVARNILKVYGVLKPKGGFLSTPIGFSPEAHALYETEYHRIETLPAASSNAGKLLIRLPLYARKLAVIVAIMNGEHEISTGALEAAIAWVEYAAATINLVAATAMDRQRAKILADDGKAVLAALKDLGGDAKPLPSVEVRRKAQLDKKRFEAAVGRLQREAPSPIVVSEETWTIGQGAQRSRAMLMLAGDCVVETSQPDVAF